MGPVPATQNDAQEGQHFDVLICGGGLAGLTLARQLRRELPSLSLAVVERTQRPLDEACHKVGESSVELGSQYLERLGLTDYLLSQHLVKFGLRFFPGGGQRPLVERAELGPSQEPPVRSYQIDRGRFENDLRGMLEQDGVTLFEGVQVREVELGSAGAVHRARLHPVGNAASTNAAAGDDTATHSAKSPDRNVPQSVSARWFVDATGRAALLRSKLRLKRGTHHAANAGWFRVRGKLDIDDFVPRGEQPSPWHDRPMTDQRWRSTNHFMGRGYWVWFIPLSSGNTSVGIVTHDEHHGFDSIRTLDKCRAFLKEHEPRLHDVLDGEEVLDFHCLHNYSHNAARCWSSDRWALVGEAGAFVDPLYSPGTDFIALANSFTAELIRVDTQVDDEAHLTQAVQELSVQYRALVMGGVDLFRDAGLLYEHARGMALKIYYDNLCYWSFPCQYFLQEIYREHGDTHYRFSEVGSRFTELSGYIQQLLRSWAKLAPEAPQPGFVAMPQFPSLVVEAHLDLELKMSPEQTLQYAKKRLLQCEELSREIVIRLLCECGPELGRAILEDAGWEKWDLKFRTERIAEEELTGLARRKGLSEIGRDLERNLGPGVKHEKWRQALELLPTVPTSSLPAVAPPKPAAEVLAQLTAREQRANDLRAGSQRAGSQQRAENS